ncbi:MAG: prephenate dehydrogenase/arogenate dehydrogenase family protein [Candidatus Bathyarchaeota archaeon]|nr:MAG: prephenate dehydrogenase/arogenate dehydrogenase family protein [Candidatus Bathyarchaeota archaeon]
MRIAIIGAGKMGLWFAKFFLEEGYSVVVASRNKEKLLKLRRKLAFETADFVEAVQNADRVLICVSINAFESVIKTISPSIREGQVVMDVCSIKDYPVKVMHKHIKNGLVLGTHPVFGPGSTSIENKTFILTPTSRQEEEFAENFKKWLETKKARVFVMTPKKHDTLMSVVLGLPHFLGLVACDTLLEQADYSETKRVAGTTYRILFTLAEVAALENPELLASLQLSLPELERIENAFIEKAYEWLNLIKQKDRATITRKMKQLKSKLMKTSPDYEHSYEIMYKMLEAAEN